MSATHFQPDVQAWRASSTCGAFYRCFPQANMMDALQHGMLPAKSCMAGQANTTTFTFLHGPLLLPGWSACSSSARSALHASHRWRSVALLLLK